MMTTGSGPGSRKRRSGDGREASRGRWTNGRRGGDLHDSWTARSRRRARFGDRKNGARSPIRSSPPARSNASLLSRHLPVAVEGDGAFTMHGVMAGDDIALDVAFEDRGHLARALRIGVGIEPPAHVAVGRPHEADGQALRRIGTRRPVLLLGGGVGWWIGALAREHQDVAGSAVGAGRELEADQTAA